MMSKNQRFTMRLNAQEKQMIHVLSQRLHCNQSDAIRLLIREALYNSEPAGASSMTPKMVSPSELQEAMRRISQFRKQES
jgi:hypothetical protein